MNTYGYAHAKPQLRNRLSRVEGQVRGVAKMVDEDSYCIDILTQISAIRAALDKVALELLRDHTTHCLSSQHDHGKDSDKVDELVTAVGRLLR